MIERTEQMRQRAGILGVIAAATFASSACAGQPELARPAPKILSVMVDPQRKELVLQGRDFGPNTPSVRLGERILPVKRSTTDQVVTELPLDLRSATYRLTVAVGDEAAPSDHVDVAIPAPVYRLHPRGSGRLSDSVSN